MNDKNLEKIYIIETKKVINYPSGRGYGKKRGEKCP
jgi:hypothetical protein